MRERMRSMDSSLTSRPIRRGLHAGIGIRIGSHDDLGRPRRGGITLTTKRFTFDDTRGMILASTAGKLSRASAEGSGNWP